MVVKIIAPPSAGFVVGFGHDRQVKVQREPYQFGRTLYGKIVFEMASELTVVLCSVFLAKDLKL